MRIRIATILTVLLLIGGSFYLWLLPAKTPAQYSETGRKEAPAPHAAVAPSASRAAQSALPLEVPEPELTPYVRPAVQNPDLQVFVDREAVGERVWPDQTTRLPRVVEPADVAAVRAVLADSRDDDTVRHEAVELLRRSEYPGLTDDLIKVLKAPGEKARFRSWCVQHLGVSAQRGQDLKVILPVLLKSLEDRHAEVRREALLALTRLKHPIAEETLRKWLSEPSKEAEASRDLVIRLAFDLNLRDELLAIRSCVGSANENIRVAALDVLSQWGDRASRQAFEEAARSVSPRIQSAGKRALERIGVRIR